MGKFDNHLREAEEAKLGLKKAQERIKVKALVLSAKSKIESKRAELQSEYDAIVTALEQSTKGLAAGISPVLQGLAGDAVQDSTEHLVSPQLDSPIQ